MPDDFGESRLSQEVKAVRLAIEALRERADELEIDAWFDMADTLLTDLEDGPEDFCDDVYDPATGKRIEEDEG